MHRFYHVHPVCELVSIMYMPAYVATHVWDVLQSSDAAAPCGAALLIQATHSSNIHI